MAKLIVFDCDSTLSSIEGIDELGRAAGEETFQQIEALTNAAMNGDIQLNEVFKRRLEIIRPTLAQCKSVAKQYIDTVEPTARQTIAKLKQLGFTPIILSGGFKRLIEPLAQHLGIQHIEAVPLNLDVEGNYISFDNTYPTTYNGGKTEIIKHLKKQYNATFVTMVGDGISDLETKPAVDLFVGFGKYTTRPAVQEQSEHFIYSLDELLPLLSTE